MVRWMLANLILAASLQGSVPPPIAPAPTWCDPFLIFFEPGSSSVPPPQQRIVDNIAAAREGFKSHIEVIGHTDTSGPAAYNMGLSRRRAEAVKRALVAKGIESGLIVVKSDEETKLLVETEDGSPEPHNRRVEVCFY